MNWAEWVPRWASNREPASGPWPAAISSAAAFSTSQPPSCWCDSMWELSRGYRAEETQPTRSPASRSKERSSSSQEEAVSWRKKKRGGERVNTHVGIESRETKFPFKLWSCFAFFIPEKNTCQDKQPKILNECIQFLFQVSTLNIYWLTEDWKQLVELNLYHPLRFAEIRFCSSMQPRQQEPLNDVWLQCYTFSVRSHPVLTRGWPPFFSHVLSITHSFSQPPIHPHTHTHTTLFPLFFLLFAASRLLKVFRAYAHRVINRPLYNILIPSSTWLHQWITCKFKQLNAVRAAKSGLQAMQKPGWVLGLRGPSLHDSARLLCTLSPVC